ncbi:MAG: hypothetical protein ACFCVD_03245 [Nodosilinea sp.]
MLAFNIHHVGREPQPDTVNLFLRDGSSQVVGGLLGWWRWGWLYVDKLWVAEAYGQLGIVVVLILRLGVKLTARLLGCQPVGR